MQCYKKLRQQLRSFKHKQRQPRQEVEACFYLQKVAQKLDLIAVRSPPLYGVASTVGAQSFLFARSLADQKLLRINIVMMVIILKNNCFCSFIHRKN